MMSLSRMIPLGLVVIGLCISGCTTWPTSQGIQSRSARSGESDSFDAPNAGRSRAHLNAGLARKRGTTPGDAMHYYTNQRIAMVARPARYRGSELARVEVWWTDNNGFHWHKAGRFERGQSFFPFDVKEDGDYGIRFVGPGEEPAQRVLAFPERTYHVDTVQPEVQVLVDPEQADYHVGDLVSIDWMVQDFQLEQYPVSIEVLLDRGDANTRPIEVQRDLPDEGSLIYGIPPEALGREITFRVEARDRTGNLGLAYTGAIRVVEDPMATDVAEAELDENEIGSTDHVAVVGGDPQEEIDASSPVDEEEPALIVGPILVLSDRREGGAAEDDDAMIGFEPMIEFDPRVAEKSDNTADQERATDEAKLAEAARLAAEVKSRATMLASRAVEAIGGLLDRWVASAKLASIGEKAETQTPAPPAAAVVDADDTEELDPGQATQTPPAFAAAEQPIDASTADVAVQEPLVANAAETEADETATSPADSTLLEFGPRIVMSEEPIEEDPAPGLPPADEPIAVAISEDYKTDELGDLAPQAPQMTQREPEARPLAALDKGIADEAEGPPPDRVAPRSSDLPFATAIARLPTIDAQIADDVFDPEGFLTDDAATRDADVTQPLAKTTEPMPEEDATATDETGEAFDEDEQDQDSAAIAAVPSAEQSDDDDPFLPALSIEDLTSFDPTGGNGLLIPMPATMEDEELPLRVTAHPWRILGRRPGSLEEAIWALPDRRSDAGWRPVLAGRFLADDPTLRDVAEPGNATLPTLAGTTEDMIDDQTSDEP